MVFRFESSELTDKPVNNFKNDGSFLETFKKLQSSRTRREGNPSTSSGDPPSSKSSKSGSSSSSGASSSSSSTSSSSASSSSGAGPAAVSKPPPPPIIGKRRGGRVLPTGVVKKAKVDDEKEEAPKDAWAVYLREVKKYRETTCQEDDNKTRPLVK